MSNLKESMDALAELVQSRMGAFEKELQKSDTKSDTVSSLAEDFNLFRKLILTTLTALQKQVDLLAVETDNIEMRSRRNLLLFHGIPEDKQQQDLANTIVKLGQQHLSLPKFEAVGLTQVHRLGRSVATRPRPVLVKFQFVKDRDSFWAAKVGLKGTGITVSEFLTKRRQKLFLEARSKLGITNCWTSNGKINALNSDGKRYSLYCQADLDKLTAAAESNKPLKVAVNEDCTIQPSTSSAKEAPLKRSRTATTVKKTK